MDLCRLFLPTAFSFYGTEKPHEPRSRLEMFFNILKVSQRKSHFILEDIKITRERQQVIMTVNRVECCRQDFTYFFMDWI